MAVGFTKDDGVNDQIEDTINDAINAARVAIKSTTSTGYCCDCGCRIPDARLAVAPWATHCVPCKEESETIFKSNMNRRASKDALLR